MYDYMLLFVLAAAGSSLGWLLAKTLHERARKEAQTPKEVEHLIKAFHAAALDIREVVYKSERKTNELRDDIIIYFKGMRDDLRAVLEKTEKTETKKDGT